MKFQRANTRKVRATVELTPLIDVVFQLLIFFMLSSTFVVQSSVPVELPEAEGGVQLERKELTITLVHGDGGPEDGGAVYIDDVPINNWTQLTRALVELREREPEPQVLIRSDGRVPTARFVKVMGFARSVGIENYGIAATAPTEEN